MSRHHQPTAENKNKVEKRHRVSEAKRMRNSATKNRARTLVARVRRAADTGDKQEAEAGLTAALSALDKAASKGAIHRNTASRRKSRLTRAVQRAAS